MVIVITLNRAIIKIGYRVRTQGSLDELKLRRCLTKERSRIFGIYVASGRILTTHQNLLSIRPEQGDAGSELEIYQSKKSSVIQNLLCIVFFDLTLYSEVSGQSNSLWPGFLIVRVFSDLTEFGLQLDSVSWVFSNLNDANDCMILHCNQYGFKVY